MCMYLAQRTAACSYILLCIIFITLTANKALVLFSALHGCLMWFHWRGKHYLWIVDMQISLISVVAGCRYNLLLIQMKNVISGRVAPIPTSQLIMFCVDTKPDDYFLNWGYSDCNLCQVPAVLFTKNTLMLSKKRNRCTSATSDTKMNICIL